MVVQVAFCQLLQEICIKSQSNVFFHLSFQMSKVQHVPPNHLLKISMVFKIAVLTLKLDFFFFFFVVLYVHIFLILFRVFPTKTVLISREMKLKFFLF